MVPILMGPQRVIETLDMTSAEPKIRASGTQYKATDFLRDIGCIWYVYLCFFFVFVFCPCTSPCGKDHT